MSPKHHSEQDTKALLVGGALILLVGVYFIGRAIFLNRKDRAVELAAPQVTEEKSSLPLMDAQTLLKKIQNGDVINLLDVREEAAFQAEHLPHSLNVPIGSLENFSPNSKDEAVVIIFSESDPAVFDAAKNIMGQKSFAYFFLKGGFEGWKAAHAPTISAGDPNSFVDQSKITYIKTEEYKKLAEQIDARIYSGVFVLDVQAPDNFKRKHLKGAVNVPLNQLEQRVEEIKTDKQIIVYGENDLASFQGGVRLADLGIFSARVLNSGGKDYFSADSPLPLEP